MKSIIQCVPNFSEGRSIESVKSIVDAISAAAPVKVIDYSLDPDHNRSVITFIGPIEYIADAMLAGAEKAIELIDLNNHQGGHPRIGAVDVIPVVPVENVSREQAVDLSRTIGKRIGSELSIPVYLYEWSAARPDRQNLATVRKGGFETIRGIDLTGDRLPDFGPARIHPTAGAVAVGARGPLVAYNVNLATSDINAAKKIAAKIRSLRGTDRELKGIKAIGVYLASRNIAQVSTNITDPEICGLFDIYEFIRQCAAEMGVEVLESELIGASRLQFLLDALQKSMKFTSLKQDIVIDRHIE